MGTDGVITYEEGLVPLKTYHIECVSYRGVADTYDHFYGIRTTQGSVEYYHMNNFMSIDEHREFIINNVIDGS